ncbi:MAG: CfrBI family restriction endonuclease [Spirochaetaceae bacterium]|nr:CfrBI family restriction endonuclease [Spirochaetaceae bacterium]
MITFEEAVVKDTISKLLKGEDYRTVVINAINVEFLDFAIKFFKEIIDAKYHNTHINLEWYKERFINSKLLLPEEAAIYAGVNKKTITNIKGTATKEVVLEFANENFEYLAAMVSALEDDTQAGLSVIIKLSYNGISVELSLTESLLVINALATKKMAIRGGAWSAMGKKVEKPLMLALCKLCDVPEEYINSEIFKKDENKDFDREIDFKLWNKDKTQSYKVEVKLMGRGNPESADVVFARDTDIFITDTLSEQNKAQFFANNVKFLELKGNRQVKEQFMELLNSLNI